MILFITNKEDVTTDIIIEKLNKTEISYYRLNTENLTSTVRINLSFEANKFEITDTLSEKTINLLDVKSVYYRRPKLPNFDHLTVSASEKSFLLNETYYLLEGLYKILSSKFWISSVFSIREAENKIYQLILAKKFGFKMPKSLITSEPSNAKEFYKRKACIIKPIKTGFIKDKSKSKVIFTSLIPENNEAMFDRASTFPVFLQTNIVKQGDIRVTIVGDKIFSTFISSQNNEETLIDWRKGSNPDLEFKRHEIPNDVAEKCLKLNKTLGLNFSAIDFVLNTDGEYTFLEINPNGQWGWIEKRTKYDISNEIIRLLKKAK
jgi:glutathione synthase/RimK-type ligase-like ATP-grasp enzyme